MQALTCLDSSFFAAAAAFFTRRTVLMWEAQYPPSIHPDRSLDDPTPHFQLLHAACIVIQHVNRVISHFQPGLGVFSPMEE